MKKYITFLVLAFACTYQAIAQTTTAYSTQHKPTGWYVEAAGQSIIGVTFNYEYYFSKKPGGFSLHAGFGGGYLPSLFSDKLTLFGAIPIGLSYNIPVSADKQHFIEVGTGYSMLFADGSSASLGFTVTGYRYQSSSGKIQVRATLYPAFFIMGHNGDTGALPWVGFSIGRRF